MSSLPVRAIAMMVALQAAWVLTSATPCKAQEAKQFQAEPTRTGKERLGGKASDEQRVDNCKVPPELRGPKPRADDCPDAANTRPAR
jgi:hypothetical protein